jgi:hypothetical protein
MNECFPFPAAPGYASATFLIRTAAAKGKIPDDAQIRHFQGNLALSTRLLHRLPAWMRSPAWFALRRP